ncbi:hypothetical protein [Micromonospora orduensis]|uniref:hypothetical protein n=1 Tax=Micromonospora orduensis TaxID=1420891 RepID=UPI0033FD86BF
MTTATLERTTRPLMLPPPGVRPCYVRPPQWWDVGHERNIDAIALCGICPFLADCKPVTGTPYKQILAGIPYGERGRPLPLCDTCTNPITNGSRRGIGGVIRCDPCRDKLIAEHHNTIKDLREQRYSFDYIGRVVGLSAGSVRHYCNRHFPAVAA